MRSKVVAPILAVAASLSLVSMTVAPIASAAVHAKKHHKTWVVVMKPNKNLGIVFSPSKLKIKVGDSVIWSNKSNSFEDAADSAGKWKTKPIRQNHKSTPIKFKKKKTYNYYSDYDSTMFGKLIVK